MLNPQSIFLELFIKLPSQKWISRNLLTLKQEFQCELNLARRSRRLNMAEGGRADVVVRHAKVHPVQDIEKLSTELQGRGICQSKILEEGEIPLGEAGGLNDISAGTTEGAQLCVLLERLGVEPFARGFGTIVRVAHQVRAVADKPRDLGGLSLEGRVAGVIDRKWGSCRGRKDAVQLPVAQGAPIPALRLLPEGEFPLIAEDKALAGIEERAAILRGQIPRILREVVFAGDEGGSRPSDIET